jgi:uncharacterized protein
LAVRCSNRQLGRERRRRSSGRIATPADRVYADSSALVKLIVRELESDRLRDFLAGAPQPLLTSRLAHVEVRRAALVRSRQGVVAARRTAELLAACRLVEVSAEVVDAAASLAGPALRTRDAIHLASALAVQADTLVGYDKELLAAATASGLEALAP